MSEKRPDKPEAPEKPKTSLTADNLREMIEQVAQAQLKPIAEKMSALETSLSKSSKVEDVAQHIRDCPECYSKVWDLFKSAKHECVNCGLPWVQDEATISKDDFSCPGCKSTVYTDRAKK